MEPSFVFAGVIELGLIARDRQRWVHTVLTKAPSTSPFANGICIHIQGFFPLEYVKQAQLQCLNCSFFDLNTSTPQALALGDAVRMEGKR